MTRRREISLDWATKLGHAGVSPPDFDQTADAINIDNFEICQQFCTIFSRIPRSSNLYYPLIRIKCQKVLKITISYKTS